MRAQTGNACASLHNLALDLIISKLSFQVTKGIPDPGCLILGSAGLPVSKGVI